MKTNFKRLFALLLTLCTLASLMVPVAFAENTETETPSATAAETYQIRVKDMDNIDPANPTDKVDALFVDDNGAFLANYNANKLVSKVSGFYDTYGWKFYAASDNLVYYLNQMYMARLPYKGWAALQIKVSDAGLYALNLKTDKTVDDETANTPWTNASSAWTGDVSAYIIPLADADTAVSSETGLESLMTEKYSVGTVNMAADVDNITFAKTRMEAGEYVVVYYAENNYSICEMSLLTTAADAAQYELVDVETYPIRLSDPASIPTTEPGTWVLKNGAYNSTNLSTLETKLSDAYAAGDLNWKYLASNTTDPAEVILRKNVNMMLRIKKSTDNSELTALQIKVPQSGTYALTVGTDRTAAYEATSLTNSLATLAFNITAYLVNVNDLAEAVTADNIASLAVDANCVGTAALAADASSGVFNRTYLEAGEYVLIFKTGTSNAAISEFTLAQRAYEVLPENEEVVVEDVTYNFEIYNSERYVPIFTKDGAIVNRNFANFACTALDGVYTTADSVGTILEKEYTSGNINWKLESQGTMANAAFRAQKATGLRIEKAASETAESPYAAFRINVPASGIYDVDMTFGSAWYTSANVYLYDADAEGDIAANMTEANLAVSLTGSATTGSFASVITAGEHIVVFEIPESTKANYIDIQNITLKVNDDPTSISFDLSTNEAYIAAIKAASNGHIETIAWGGSNNMRKITYSYEETITDETTNETTTQTVEGTVNPYVELAKLFTSGQIDWALDYSALLNTTNTLNSVNPCEGSMRFRMPTDGSGYAGIRIRVNSVGLYNITLNGTFEGDDITAYLFPAPAAYTSFSNCVDLSSYLVGDTYKLGTSDTSPFAITGSYNFEEVGEYVVVLKNNDDIWLSSMELEPINAAVYADGVAYGSLDAALAKATDSIVLDENVAAGDLVVPAGVTLDLNGYSLYAASVEFGAAADIIDSADGKGLLRGDVTFEIGNAQLPLYDVDDDGYRLFNVDVVSCATTGTGNQTKYWFKINFSNSDVFDLIGATTELRIMANMTGVYKTGHELEGQEFAAPAIADAAFSNVWAAKNTSYIVLSTVGSSGLEQFELKPAVTANGVVISGDAMTKG